MVRTKTPDATYPGHTSLLNRRRFLRRAGGAAAAAGAVLLPRPSETGARVAEAAGAPALKARRRADKAYQIRLKAALDEKNLPLPPHVTNGDDARYASKIGSYSKALPHNALGEVDAGAYAALARAMETGDPADFDAVPSGGAVKQTNPQAALAFDLTGADSHHIGMPAPPAFDSEDQAAEMCECYWLALTRDIPFSQYGSEPLTRAAIDDLARFSRFKGIDAGSLFRGETPGDLAGPYVSQFLLKPYNFGSLPVTQRFRTPLPGDDHMTSYGDWLNIQKGVPPSGRNAYDPTPRYVRNGRDLAEWDHQDFTYQGFLVAALILLGFGPAALDDANPYKYYVNQSGFACFGGPHVLDMVARAANLGLKAAWYQKWSVHRRLRPEAFGGRVHNHKTRAASYPIHPGLLNSEAVREVHHRHGSYLLPMAYPEGSPTHPSYPAGHAVIAGACVTVLKAFFKESFAIPNPSTVTKDGLALVPYAGALKAGAELNKLAANVALGRDTAGVHWRSDGIEGMKFGEQVALSLLRGYKDCFNESFEGFSLTKFNGAVVTV